MSLFLFVGTLEVYLLTGELSSWFRLIESLNMTCAKPYEGFLNLSLDCFLQSKVLPKISKISDLARVTKMNKRVNFDFLKSAEWLSVLNYSKSENRPVWKSRYFKSWRTWKHQIGHHVNLIQRVQLGPLPHQVVTSLPHNHVILTNLFISSYRGATIIKFGK